MSNKALFKKDRAEKWLPVGQLHKKYADAQRDLNPRKVARMVADFDPYAIGRIQVAHVNGSYHIVDGQHRVAAVREMWGDDEMVPCDVIPADSAADAAELFLKTNDERSPIQAIDRFRIAVTAERPDFVAVNDLLTGLGYTIVTDSTDGSFAAVAAAMSIYRKHGTELLKEALLVIQGTWGRQRDATHGKIVQGYADLLGHYGSAVDRKRLVDRAAKELTPANLLGRGKAMSEMIRRPQPEGIMRVLVAVYNHGLRTDIRLEEPGY